MCNYYNYKEKQVFCQRGRPVLFEIRFFCAIGTKKEDFSSYF